MTSLPQRIAQYGSFVKYGYGKSVDFDERWMEKEAARARWWSEYGNAPDPFDLPSKIRDVHLAIMRGKDKKQQEEQRKADREANKAK